MSIKKLALAFVLGLAIALVIGVAWPSRVAVNLTNVGAVTMRSVVVHVTGASHKVGDIAPGETRTVKVNPTGESHVELTQAGGPRLKIDSYFERNYEGYVDARITSTSVVGYKVLTRPAGFF